MIFYGRVQGVGFRYYAVHKARSLGLTGWVQNLYDGTVEMEVQGTEQDICMLIDYLQGRTYIDITGIHKTTQPLKEERNFVERGY